MGLDWLGVSGRFVVMDGIDVVGWGRGAGECGDGGEFDCCGCYDDDRLLLILIGVWFVIF